MLLENVVRSFRSSVTWKTIDDERLWQGATSWGRIAKTGEYVNADKAMGLPVYWACGRNIAEDMAKCPLVIYRDDDSGNREKAKDHPLYNTLRYQFNPNVSAMSGKESLFFGALFWHGGFAEIVRDKGKIHLYPIHPSRVRKVVDGGNVYWAVLSNGDDSWEHPAMLSDDEMFHIHGIGPTGEEGYSLLEVGLNAIGRGLAIQSFSSTFYRNGTHLSGVLKHPMQLKPDERANLREEWAQMHQGVMNQHRIAVLQEGMEFQPIGMPLDQAQFIETEKMTDLQLCQLCRMPPEKVGFRERAQGWSTLEMLNADYVTDTLMPWDVRISQEVNRKFLSDDPNLFAETDFNALMRGSSESRAKFYHTLWTMKAITPDEIRHKENMNALPEDAFPEPAAVAPAAPVPAEEPDEEARAFDPGPLIQDAAERCARREAKAVNRGARKDEETFESWKEKFYGEHEGFMFLAFRPVAQVLGVPIEEVRAACAAYCTERVATLMAGDALSDAGAQEKIENEVGGVFHAQSNL